MDKIRKDDFWICSAEAFIEIPSRMTLFCIMEHILKIYREKCRGYIFTNLKIMFTDKVKSNLFSQICMS